MLLYIKLVIVLSIAIHISATDNKKPCNSDSVIEYLLRNENITRPSEVEDVDEPVLITGIWKCGNCTDIDDAILVYSQDNYNDTADIDGDVDTQIEMMLEGMKCVTVSADKPGVVQRITGSCEGDAVTLHMAPSPSSHFLIQVYG